MQQASWEGSLLLSGSSPKLRRCRVPEHGHGQKWGSALPPLRNESKYFQRMTTNPSVEGKQNLVIKGRKTWLSIPQKNRPLKDRINTVLSRELKELLYGAHFLANSLKDALKLTEQPELASKIDTVWIVEGSCVYKEAMNQPGHIKLFVTRIMQEFESDTFFPEIDLEKYKLLPEYPGVLSEVQEEKALITNLKYMKKMINVKMFSDLFQVIPPSEKLYVSTLE